MGGRLLPRATLVTRLGHQPKRKFAPEGSSGQCHQLSPCMSLHGRGNSAFEHGRDSILQVSAEQEDAGKAILQ
jgi:hypothetical protein